MKNRNIVLHTTPILLTVFFMLSCKSDKDANIEAEKQPIVSVNQKTLYKADLDNAIPMGLSVKDSIQSAEAYIKMWIYDELIYEKAKQNVADKARIDEMVDKYKQSLTQFTYLEQLLKEELSKKLSDSELKDYYDKNTETFKLEENLIKGLFLKVPKSSPELNNLRQWYKSNTETAKENIEKTSIQNTVIYDYFYDRWVSADDVVSNIPVPISSTKEFIRTNKNFETQDSSYVYLLHIEEYIPLGGNAPFDYAKPMIKDIIINKNRETFLKKFEEDLYNKAIMDDNITYHIERKEDNTQ